MAKTARRSILQARAARSSEEQPGDRRQLLWCIAAVAGAVLFVFREFLFGEGDRIPSHHLGDTVRQFVFLRDFASRELLEGNIPLWNPYSFSGTGYIGMFQSSMFYPSNVFYLFLPIDSAVVLEFMVDFLLLGVFVVLWLRGRGLHVVAAGFAAISVLFSGSCLLRLLAGQLTVLGTVAWMPLLLLTIDRLAERPSLRWLLAGVAAVTMMVLAGHPPTLFMAAITAGLYCIPPLIESRDRTRLIASLLALGVLPIFASAVQLWTGLQMATEGLRQGGMPYEFATTFSMPPENLLTWFSPSFFGKGVEGYVGRWFYWDASAYFGVVSLVLALHGALVGRGALRRIALVLACSLVVLSLGRYTPIYRLLYEVVPGFSYLRAPSKFLFFATLFGAALAGIGVDRLLREAAGARRTALFGMAMALALAILGGVLWESTRSLPFGAPASWLAAFDGFPAFSAKRAAQWNDALFQASAASVCLLAVISALLWARQRYSWVVWGVLALGTLELVSFADSNHGSSSVWAGRTRAPDLMALYARSGQDRVLEMDRISNVSMHARGYNFWGYDPIVLWRYAKFMAFTQDLEVYDLDNVAGQRPKRFHPLFSMLRGKYQINPYRGVKEHPDPLPRFLLLREHRVIPDPDDVLAELGNPQFDPRRGVLLEEAPIPAPSGTGNAGTITLLDESTDHMTLQVELDSAAILLVTDSYSEGWRAHALPGSAQAAYRVLPANLILRAVPLSAGRHELRMVYEPMSFRAGAWSSGISLVIWLGAAGVALRARRAAQLASPMPDTGEMGSLPR